MRLVADNATTPPPCAFKYPKQCSIICEIKDTKSSLIGKIVFHVSLWTNGREVNSRLAGSLNGLLGHGSIFKSKLGLERVHPASRGQLGSYLIEKWRIWLRKPTLINLTNIMLTSLSRNAIACQSVPEVWLISVASLGVVSHRFNFIFILFIYLLLYYFKHFNIYIYIYIYTHT